MSFHAAGANNGSTPPRVGDSYATNGRNDALSSPPLSLTPPQQPNGQIDQGSKRRRNPKKAVSGGTRNGGGEATTPTPPAKRCDATNTPTTVTHAQPSDLVVLVSRTDLFDAAQPSESMGQPQPNSSDEAMSDPFVLHSSSSLSTTASPVPGFPCPPIAAYQYRPLGTSSRMDTGQSSSYSALTLAICRVPPSPTVVNQFWMEQLVFDKTLPPPTLLLDRSMHKYWNQRRRLFSRFDLGIQLDPEGWFSVTPEQIADHVAARSLDLYRVIQHYHPSPPSAPKVPPGSMHPGPQQHQPQRGMVVLDAFCGCGGNSIAFAKLDGVDQVICVDIDRTKLHRAANNAAIYQIPANKLVFVECNVLFLLEHCYKNGDFILDQPIESQEKAMAMMSAMPPPVMTETSHGYSIGGIDMLPRIIDAVFMDPPWGGVDYEVFGKNGYCLETNMRIPRPANQVKAPPTTTEGVTDGFFDTFCSSPHNPNHQRNKQERKAAFNCGLDENNCVNGAELLQLAAAAATHAQVVYDIPRNTSRTSLGQAALTAGYRGNCKLDEHHLNGRLKTVTAYFGTDWRSSLLMDTPME